MLKKVRCTYSDAGGVDAVKDANAMLGNRNHFDDEGYWYAKKRGWIRTVPKPERDEIDVED